jgi:hypothetical protein
MDDINDMRSANYNAWKTKHDKEVKKCKCATPKPRPTYLNECWECNGEIYKDYLNRVRWANLKQN